ncbi:hypothetical protein CHS0354_011562 [Potamilus streckersoni]|uniref:Apple domain-containing protein n=1 Tax=Potamilus streckersoni TaxID=2493646 RepID=A0AAE0RRI3_9BIVA|nr:hypothetical protein CHS0354_011562 [Potamilus streckersoni]
MEYALSQDTCERGTYLGQFSFGQFIPRSVFTTKYEVSPYQCATECQLRRQRCKSFNYRRSVLSCQLCEEDSGPGGINLQPKAGSDHSNIDTWRNDNPIKPYILPLVSLPSYLLIYDAVINGE